MVAEITGIFVVLPRALHTPLINIELWIPGAGVHQLELLGITDIFTHQSGIGF